MYTSDPKSVLNTWCQQNRQPLPFYVRLPGRIQLKVGGRSWSQEWPPDCSAQKIEKALAALAYRYLTTWLVVSGPAPESLVREYAHIKSIEMPVGSTRFCFALGMMLGGNPEISIKVALPEGSTLEPLDERVTVIRL